MENSLQMDFKPKKVRWTILFGLILLFLSGYAFSQERIIAGKVTSATEGTLPGVSVIAKGTVIGTATDEDGTYRLSVPVSADSLTFSFIGYSSQTVYIGTRNTIDVVMALDSRELSEVVVTALGVKREEKELGYVVQEIKGENLTQARETNLVNSLAGKIAGVTVTGSPSGIGGSSRITIRGERSLNISKNQPLFVVDGLPISNEMNGSSGRSNQEADYGNGAGFINPDDIETITVLKGANAAALYGSRANNGVILITTKSGKGSKGIGVSVNSTTTFENALRLPDYQNKYGQGLNGEFAYVDGAGAGLRDGVDESWGPAFQGQLIPQHDSPRNAEYLPGVPYRGGDLSAPSESTIIPTPWVARPNNIRDFFETGRTLTNNVAVAGSNEFGDFRLSYTNLDQTGIVPNTDLKRNTFALSGGANLTRKLTAKASVNYIKSESGNRPNLSYGTENIMYLLSCWLGRQVDLNGLKDYWQRGQEGVQQYNFNYNYHDNPYFQLDENTNSQDLDRVIGNISLSYQFADWLSLQVRTQTDFSNEVRERKRAFSTQRFPYGSYREEKLFFEERNTDFLVSANKTLNEDFALSLSVGGNQMRQVRKLTDATAPQLNVPGIYNLGNARVPLQTSQFSSEKRINSVYGFGQIAFKDYLFLDLTARNDWSSTLPAKNRSYFYPSASVSAVVSEMLRLNEATPISFAKLRAGWAQVGNDTDPYALSQPFNYENAFGTYPTLTESSTLVNTNLKPEISTSLEVGGNIKFLNNRLGVDVTYYDITSKNQILRLPVTNTSGYGYQTINAGEIQNWGWEVMFNAVPVTLKNGFKWNIDINFSKNNSKVKSLYSDLETYQIASKEISVEARVGGRMGDIYGNGFLRVKDKSSPYYGQIIYDNDGHHKSEYMKLGNYNPDWLAGVYNTFSYKGVQFGILFDIRKGGEVYSHTLTVGREAGQLEETLEGRANGYDLSLPGNGVIGEGVIENENGTYRPNDVKLSAREWHTSITDGRSIKESSIFDASYIKLREVKLSYTIPNKVFGKLPIRNAQISLVGRNLALWTKVPHIDPETYALSGGTIVPGAEVVSIPTTKSYGFNIGFQF